MATITDEQAAAYARKTGYPRDEARRVLSELEEPLRARVIRAAMAQVAAEPRWLYDPIEDESAVQAILQQAEREAEADLAAKGIKEELGYCHVLWFAKARILASRYGITWYSPAEMNGHITFD